MFVKARKYGKIKNLINELERTTPFTAAQWSKLAHTAMMSQGCKFYKALKFVDSIYKSSFKGGVDYKLFSEFVTHLCKSLKEEFPEQDSHISCEVFKINTEGKLLTDEDTAEFESMFRKHINNMDWAVPPDFAKTRWADLEKYLTALQKEISAGRLGVGPYAKLKKELFTLNVELDKVVNKLNTPKPKAREEERTAESKEHITIPDTDPEYQKFKLMYDMLTHAKEVNGVWFPNWTDKYERKAIVSRQASEVKVDFWNTNVYGVFGIAYSCREFAEQAKEKFADRIKKYY